MALNDPFDEVLGLEDNFYQDGFKLGQADGARAGLVEGRFFGLEKGFDKFVDMGRLHGRSVVWASRVTNSSAPAASALREDHDGEQPERAFQSYACHNGQDTIALAHRLPPLGDSSRLEKHIRTLYALTEPESLSTQNNENDVSDFDDRFKRAIARATIIGKLVNEDSGTSQSARATSGEAGRNPIRKNTVDASIEDTNILRARH